MISLNDLSFLEPTNEDERRYIDACKRNPEPFPERCMVGGMGKLAQAFAEAAPQYPLGWIYVCVLDAIDKQTGVSRQCSLGSKSLRAEMVEFAIGK